MNDQGFPHIKYQEGLTPKQWGESHGEEFKEGIHELASIRRDLMIKKSPHLREEITRLAREQFEITRDYSKDLATELEGISMGANCSVEDLIILNNYTDFRDINLPDEGCTSLSFFDSSMVSAQTWDMHSSAKNYICSLELPNGTILFSLVGCLGMMGVNSQGLFIGVNNINTKDARAGVIWSAFVRSILKRKSLNEARELMKATPFTSGHNYLLSDQNTAEHWEASPTKIAKASSLTEKSVIYHTNHCLTSELRSVEETLSQNSTSNERFALIEKKKDSLKSAQDVFELLHDHEGYPKSLCGHFQSGATDPSSTCGGALYDYQEREFTLWRGCRMYDENYKVRSYKV